jgi:hypothetical protein
VHPRQERHRPNEILRAPTRRRRALVQEQRLLTQSQARAQPAP